jgi:hypothetical protein
VYSCQQQEAKDGEHGYTHSCLQSEARIDTDYNGYQDDGGKQLKQTQARIVTIQCRSIAAGLPRSYSVAKRHCVFCAHLCTQLFTQVFTLALIFSVVLLLTDWIQVRPHPKRNYLTHRKRCIKQRFPHSYGEKYRSSRS